MKVPSGFFSNILYKVIHPSIRRYKYSNKYNPCRLIYLTLAKIICDFPPQTKTLFLLSIKNSLDKMFVNEYEVFFKKKKYWDYFLSSFQNLRSHFIRMEPLEGCRFIFHISLTKDCALKRKLELHLKRDFWSRGNFLIQKKLQNQRKKFQNKKLCWECNRILKSLFFSLIWV